MGTVNCLITSILQNILFYVQVRNKYRFGTTLRMSDFHFWVNSHFSQFSFLSEYPFKMKEHHLHLEGEYIFSKLKFE